MRISKSASSSLSDTKLITLGKSCKSSYCIFSLTRYAYWAKCSTITFIHLGFFHFCMGALAFFWSGSWLLLFGFIRNLLNFSEGKAFLVFFFFLQKPWQYIKFSDEDFSISLSLNHYLHTHLNITCLMCIYTYVLYICKVIEFCPEEVQPLLT